MGDQQRDRASTTDELASKGTAQTQSETADIEGRQGEAQDSQGMGGEGVRELSEDGPGNSEGPGEDSRDRAADDTDERTGVGRAAPPTTPTPLEMAQSLGISYDVLAASWQKSSDGRRAAALEEKRLQLELQRLEKTFELDLKRLESEARANERELEARTEVEQRRIGLESDTAMRSSLLPKWEALTRFILALILVAGTMLIVAWGVIADRDPELVTQYVAPIAGLAGLAVGYFFSRGV